MREEIMNRIAEAVRKELGFECEVQIQDMAKNNGLVKKAVTIREPEMAASQAVYIDGVLDQLMFGRINIWEAAHGIADTYLKWRNTGNFGEIASNLSGRSILDGVTYQLINAEKNEERLADMPYKRFLDLAVVYRVIVSEDEMGTFSLLISNRLLEKYELDEEKIDTAAQRNTERHGFQIESMESIIAEITGEPEDEIKTGCLMWVLTNTKKLNGAAVMLYPGIFKDLADKIGGDLYVLPSSIHEVIAIPDHGVEPEELKSIVDAVNTNEVSEDEFLSGNVYKYIRKENRMVIA